MSFQWSFPQKGFTVVYPKLQAIALQVVFSELLFGGHI